MVLLLTLPYTQQPTNMENNNNNNNDENSSSGGHDTATETSSTSDKENGGMGNRSQQRKKATRRKKDRPKHVIIDNRYKKATKQTFLFGIEPPKDTFDRFTECEICKAIKECRPVPHRGHHYRCEKNAKYGRLRLSEKQAKAVEEAEQLEKELSKKLPIPSAQKQRDKEARQLKKVLSEPITWGLVQDKSEAEKYFAPRPTKNNKLSNTIVNPYDKNNKTNATTTVIHPESIPTAAATTKTITLSNDNDTSNKSISNTNNMNSIEKKDESSLGSHYPSKMNNNMGDVGAAAVLASLDCSPKTDIEVPTAAVLRNYVDEYMACEKQQSRKSGCPTPIICITKYLRDNYFPSRLSNESNTIPDTALTNIAMNKYNLLFPPGCMEFTIPRENKLIQPSPWYHSVEGTKILFVQWELNFPGIYLGCTKADCCGELVHDRTNFSKNSELFPIFDTGAPHMWACLMYYKCNACNNRVAGNCGELLNQLTPFIRDAYPVHPRYATGNFHMTKKTSDLMEDLMITYGNGEYFSRSMYQRLNLEYLSRIDTYYDQNKWLQGKNVAPYPPLNEWNGTYYPDGGKFRELYEKAQTTNLTRSGIPELERYTREIQGVGCSLSMAQDHTMEVVKNYKSSEVKACWTVCNENGEIACAILVKDTKSATFAHAAECLVRRDNFKPKVMYADTWPSLSKFWALLFGATCMGRLGLFHFMTRIIKTLRDSHIDYRKSILELRKAIYKYDEMDYMRLVNALKEGKMARNGEKYTDGDIYDMQLSGKWKQRYDKWLRKIIYDSSTLKDNLNTWFDNFKCTTTRTGEDALKRAARGRKDPTTGKFLFTPDTKDAIEEGLKTCLFISDVLDINEMYTMLPPSPHSTHNLNEYVSHRVESRLEGFHDPLSNYGNSSMGSTLADILHHAGTSRYNAMIRHKLLTKQLSPGDRKKVPAHYSSVPAFYNHSELILINSTAEALGAATPFPDTLPLGPDNGERFFSLTIWNRRKEKLRLPDTPTTIVASAKSALAIRCSFCTSKFHQREC
jgi:hypothetical protein